ncbi:phosphotransferase [Brachybacterium huguangmaarense]|uniref:Maltokinase n=1 Tax=Brachybacterium huguangmaarense TaxID=1652028 RepID=A0ABY6G413_9MICO|nr:phosphotransferase [Brachybacterium huguangmaarense]UYG17950.1 phosphotransferase [Brachybacterium huguangmaarense]
MDDSTTPVTDSATASGLPALTDLVPLLLPHLVAWMPAQRWYAAKSAAPSDVCLVASAVVAQTGRDQVLDVVVRVGTAPRTTDYQVPLVLSPADAAPAAHGDPAAEIAVLAVPGGSVRVQDATRTAVGRAALLGVVVDGREIAGDGLRLRGEPVAGRGRGRIVSSRLLSGEQSNSSMIVELDGAAPVIAKLFRVLQSGDNPDVVLQGALDAAGSEQVAPLIGAARVTWGEGADADESGHALFIQEFLTGVEDAWRVALRDAVAGVDFSAGARSLGEATARVHRDLADRLPTLDPSPAERERLVSSMLARLEEARAEVPAVDAAAEPLAAVIRRTLDVAWPPFQRIHGDYHLGQVLAVPDRGWVLLDFEGEPMRPLAERSLPDCPVRDVAGMLRSLDYAAGAVLLEHATDVSAWAARARDAFLAGYREIAQIPDDDAVFAVLLAAFEADKAVYEALYEARNRPAWAPIPLAALERIAG